MYQRSAASDCSWWSPYCRLWEGRYRDSKIRLQVHWGPSYSRLPAGNI